MNRCEHHLELSHTQFKHMFIEYNSWSIIRSRVAIVHTAIRRIYFKVSRRLVGCAT